MSKKEGCGKNRNFLARFSVTLFFLFGFPPTMGVNSLWDILGPTARPVRLEALARKRMAVDASIWIYQFLKAVRDQDGKALPQSHIVGFFRRICKLLYFDILPIFVFDGGAPALKRDTINKRRERREGQRESASQTAQKLLAVHVQREAEKISQNKQDGDDVYLEDLPNTYEQHKNPTEPQSRSELFVRKDEYHLPDIKEFKVSSMDTRIMPEEEFQEYMDYSFDFVDGIDINKVDPSSEEFAKLPTATQYMILSHLRLRSRLRMGFSKEQLEDLFPNSIDFSKFQIQQVQKRNFYTQRLMDVSGMGGDGGGNITKRIAGDKDRKYALVRNEDGWTLALAGEGEEKNPISLDETGNVETRMENELGKIATRIGPSWDKPVVEVKLDDESDVEWEDVSAGEAQETEEELNMNRAVIESIYEQFREPEVPKDTSDFNEEEMKRAIELSKKDLTRLQEKEREIAERASNEDDFNFLQSLLFGGSQKAAKNIEMKPEKVDKDEIVEASTLNEPDMDARDTETDRRKRNIVEIENLASDVEKDEHFTNGEEEQVHVVQPLPSWFDNSVSQIDYTYQAQSQAETIPEKTETLRPDEEAGLISWNEAREYFEENKQSSDLEESRDDDVEEIPMPEETANEKVVQVQEPPAAEVGRKPAVLDYDFEESEENDLVKQLQTEEQVHEEFKNQIKARAPISLTSVTDEQLLQEKLQKQKRDSDEVTETMIKDVQELLKRFGIPYITAPMEAEAQCAELLKLNLVDGIVTDDSDCFLFGGDKVYKNMFNQKQYVECYSMSDIDARLGLNQDKLIELGLMLGSDYTEGIKGIGPVLAMEILAEFGNLKEFKRWYKDHTTKITRNDNLTGVRRNLLNRIKSGRLFLPETFPDPIINSAYKLPEVDHDETDFKWGIPNLDQIRSFLMFNLSWSQSRVDEVLVPLIRDMNRKKAEGTQSTIGEFFPLEYISLKKNIGIGRRMKSAADKLNKRRKVD